ncbi:MAG: hypothetical protein AAFX10_12905 [Pseudomonadota bacterium]
MFETTPEETISTRQPAGASASDGDAGPTVQAETLRQRAASGDRTKTSLPEDYWSLLEVRPSRRRMNVRELQDFFDADVRDEQWAYTMETGIGQYLAANMKEEGALIEHLECRSQLCQIAGVVYPGHSNNLSEHVVAMQQTGWWQLSGATSTVGTGSADGNYRFVTFIPRADDVVTVAPTRPDCQCE